MKNNNNADTQLVSAALKKLSAQDFLGFGLQDFAYIRAMSSDGADTYTLYAANGTPISDVINAQEALALAFQHDLEVISCH